MDYKISAISPKKLKPNPFNPNHVDPKNYAKLRKSIEDLGFASAVVVRELPDGTLQILGGQHRTQVAVELGLKEIPVINLGSIGDDKAKKIGLVDNSRYGTDDGLQLARIMEELDVGTGSLAEFLPISDEDLQVMMRAVDIDLDTLEVTLEDDDAPPPEPMEERAERPLKTHDILTFRVTNREAEAIRQLIEKTIKREGLDDGSDDKTLAGMALALLLLTKET